LPPIDIFYSLIKAVLFAIVVTLIHCYYGYNATGGPAGVGVASGRAIRASIVTIVVLNFVLSVLFWGAHATVQIAGGSRGHLRGPTHRHQLRSRPRPRGA